MAAVSRLVCYLSRTYAGKKHDKKICDEEGYTFPKHSLLFKDSGFQGYEPDQIITYQPKKKPKGGALTLADKTLNSIIASARLTVENVICGVKCSRIVKDVFRNTKADFEDLVMEIACGLHNFRTQHRHLLPSFDLIALCT